MIVPWLLSMIMAVAAENAGAASVSRGAVVSVTDKTGHMVADLAAAEVTVKENGQARAVKSVERDSRPLALAVLLDSSINVTGVFRSDLVDPVMDFVTGLPQGTEGLLMTIGTPPTVVDLKDPAGAREALKARVPFGKNSLYDAVAEAARRLGEKKGTRRVIVVVTSESFEADDQTLAIEALGKAAALLFVIQFGPTGAYPQDLDNIVKWTGGRFEPISAPSGVGKVLARLAPEWEAPWVVVYDSPAGGDKRSVEVKVSRKAVKVRPLLGGIGE